MTLALVYLIGEEASIWPVRYIIQWIRIVCRVSLPLATKVADFLSLLGLTS